MTKCSNHPDAPHGFNRSASHAEGRYVCDCECWIPDDEEITMTELTQQQVIDYLMGENGTFSERKSARIAVQRIKQQAETIEQLMLQRDSFRHEANALNLDNEQQAKTIANLQFHNKGLQAEANALKSENNQLKSELNSVNEYKDRLTAAVLVLVDQLKSGEVSLGAIYDVDFLIGE